MRARTSTHITCFRFRFSRIPARTTYTHQFQIRLLPLPPFDDAADQFNFSLFPFFFFHLCHIEEGVRRTRYVSITG